MLRALWWRPERWFERVARETPQLPPDFTLGELQRSSKSGALRPVLLAGFGLLPAALGVLGLLFLLAAGVPFWKGVAYVLLAVPSCAALGFGLGYTTSVPLGMAAGPGFLLYLAGGTLPPLLWRGGLIEHVETVHTVLRVGMMVGFGALLGCLGGNLAFRWTRPWLQRLRRRSLALATVSLGGLLAAGPILMASSPPTYLLHLFWQEFFAPIEPRPRYAPAEWSGQVSSLTFFSPVGYGFVFGGLLILALLAREGLRRDWQRVSGPLLLLCLGSGVGLALSILIYKVAPASDRTVTTFVLFAGALPLVYGLHRRILQPEPPSALISALPVALPVLALYSLAGSLSRGWSPSLPLTVVLFAVGFGLTAGPPWWNTLRRAPRAG